MDETRPPDAGGRSYAWLTRRLVIFSLLCSLLPLLGIGWAVQHHYGRFAEERVVDALLGRLGEHKKTIQLFISDRKARLQLLAGTHRLADLVEPGRLRIAFEAMNRNEWSIADLGVIDENGAHLAYEGPHDLLDRNYRDAPWFAEVMARGVYVSDMFLGFRNDPHFILAVRREEEGHTFILRATIDTDYFRSLVENVAIGKTGEIFLVSRDGRFQTSPRFRGAILADAGVALPREDSGLSVNREDARGDGPERVMASVWLEEPRWLLVVRQDADEAFGGIRHARFLTLLFVHLTAAVVLLVSLAIIRRMLRLVERRDREAQSLDRQLVTAGKLASLGELSAGVAHEVNNPLAIILTERQLLLDALERGPSAEDLAAMTRAALEQIHTQVGRCRKITHQLLRFARRTRSEVEDLDVNQLVREVGELHEREAAASGIGIEYDLAEGLPTLRTDPGELQQVLLNLMTNAVDAHDGRPDGRVRLSTRMDDDNGEVAIVCEDRGQGIPPANLDRIFDPFFTTKPVGRGTGLGLAITYGIVRQLGGRISVSSLPGEGTTFEIRLPVAGRPEPAEATP